MVVPRVGRSESECAPFGANRFQTGDPAGQVWAELAAVAQLQVGQHPVVTGDFAAAQDRTTSAFELVGVGTVGCRKVVRDRFARVQIARTDQNGRPSNVTRRIARVQHERRCVAVGAHQKQVFVDLQRSPLNVDVVIVEFGAGHTGAAKRSDDGARRNPRRRSRATQAVDVDGVVGVVNTHKRGDETGSHGVIMTANASDVYLLMRQLS